MAIDLLVGIGAIVILVVVFSSRGRRERATTDARLDVLCAAAPVIGGSISNGELTGTYKGHRVDVSLRATGRADAVGSEHSRTNNIEVVLLVLHGVSGKSPWGFFTSVSFTGSLEARWRSMITFLGVFGTLLGRLSSTPIDPAIDDRLRAGGMLEAFEKLVPRGVEAPYVLIAFIPDGAPAVAKAMQRAEAFGGEFAKRARAEAAKNLNLDGYLRIEVERADDRDPAPERLREVLEAALGVAELNASIDV